MIVRCTTHRHAFASLALALLGTGAFPRPTLAQEVPAGFIVLDSSATRIRNAALSAPVTLLSDDNSRRHAIREIGRQASLDIVFDASLPGLDERIDTRYTRVPAATALLRVLERSNIRALVTESGAQIVLVAAARARTQTRRVVGTVHGADGPVSAARVEVLGTGRGAVTHDDGTFTIAEVPVGEHAIRVTRLGYVPVSRQLLSVSDQDDARADVAMTRQATPLEAVVVTPGFYGLLETPGTSLQSLTREQLETVPQIGEDIYRAINRLPGVAASDFSAKFSVRGATADQLYVTLDGLRLIEPFHLKDIGGALSIIDIQSLGQASLMSGGAGAAYGDQIGGVFEMRSADPQADRARSGVGISLTNFRASSQGSFDEGRGGWLVSARSGFLDLAFRITSLGDSLRPRYDDAFAKVQHDLPHDGRLSVQALHSGDGLRYIDAGEELIDSRYVANYLWMTLHQPMGDRWRSESVLSAAWLDWRRTGQSSMLVSPWAKVNDKRSLRSMELRQDWSFMMTAHSTLSFGADFRNDRTQYDYERDGQRQIVANGVLTTQQEALAVHLEPRGMSVGAYVSSKLQPIEMFTLEAGLRYDDAAVVNERLFSPRVAAALQVTPTTTLRGSWGRYSQAHPLFALSVEDDERVVAPADRSNQAEVAIEQGLISGMSARVNLYQRDLTFERPRWLNAGSAVSPYPEVTYDRLRFAPERGSSRGVELELSRALHGTEWSASYALASATDVFQGRDVPRATDQRHTAHLDWAYHPSSNAWRLAVAAVWHSGTPYTPDVIHIDTLVNSPTQFTINAAWLPGPLYSERVPAYQRVDIRWTRYFLTKRGRVSVFGEVFNALGQENVRGYYTNISLNNRLVIYSRNSRTQLPRLPSAGVSWEF